MLTERRGIGSTGVAWRLELGRLCVSAAFTLSDQVQLLLGASAPGNSGSCRLMEAVGMTEGRTVQRDT